ncbi:MAG: beta-ketoacyl-[acyl-carrier-protein] synthase family protein [Acidobacteriaceae bacterium]|jgi:3-oxoacyl-[acyl-carrier-protein] synthase II|nr:beta-ketoacyl-[acyl-carrier-protein] synthase family protein [Acidobacteriaceae bacterium]
MSPNGLGRESFWRACLAGSSGVRRISRFDPADFSVQIAGEITDFDEAAWTDPKERPHISRATPLARAAAGEALAHAGLDTSQMTRDQLREVGIVLGSGGGSQEWTEQQYRHWFAGEHKQCSVYVIPTSTIGTLASEVSMYFGLRGMSHIVSTGCTSSTDAIGYAFRQIQCGMIDCMLAGGVDAPLAPLILRGFQLMRIMTQRWNHEPHRGSRPFSGDRDGFVLGEGAWMFVLEERDHALRRGATILGEISGYGSTCEAYHRVRLEECGEEPARTMQMALREAGLAPEAVQYVQYHGTSTQLNDRIESRAMRLAFGPHAYRLCGSSVKSMIGHPQGASGAAGVAVCLLAMRDGQVPPTINLETSDPDCDLDYVPKTSRPLAIEAAVANCIAFGSKNSALCLRRPA